MSENKENDFDPKFPEPTPLKRMAVLEYDWGPQHFKMLCSAATIRKEKYTTGEMVEWLHFKGVQFFREIPAEAEVKMTTYLVPANYVTKIEPGPYYHVSSGVKTIDTGVFPPIHPVPAASLGIKALDDAIANLMTAERN